MTILICACAAGGPSFWLWPASCFVWFSALEQCEIYTLA